MAAITWADVTAIAAELTTTPVAAQAIYLAYANESLNPSVFGGEDAAKTKLARIYLAAHFASAAGVGGTPLAGPVISETTGGIQRAYAQAGQAAGDNWNATTYGQKYAALVRTSLGRWPRVM